MRKIFIEDSRVDSFMADLRNRLEESLREHVVEKDDPKFLVIAVGESGTQVAQRLLQSMPEAAISGSHSPHVVAVQKNEAGDLTAVQSATDFQPLTEFLEAFDTDTPTIILDGVCRSGNTLGSVYEQVRRFSRRVWTYAIAVSAESSLIPTWYGCLYDGSEYVVLARQGVTPNTPLFAISTKGGVQQVHSPALVLRPPLQSDPEFETGAAASINRYTSDDRYFDSTTKSKSILVLEWNSEPVGFIAFHIDGRTLWIDYIVACQRHSSNKRGIGTALYYHVENYAKLRGCENISLWAISDKVGWYKRYGFHELHGARRIAIGKTSDDEEIYHPMTHRLISEAGQYHV